MIILSEVVSKLGTWTAIFYRVEILINYRVVKQELWLSTKQVNVVRSPLYLAYIL